MSGYPKTAPVFQKSGPTGYVAGAGRGAVGFSTRSDIGPGAAATRSAGVLATGMPSAQLGTQPAGFLAGRGRGLGGGVIMADAQFGVAPAGYVAGRGRGMGALASHQQQNDAFDDGGIDSTRESSTGPLIDQTVYDQDDAEADRIYNQVDEQVEARLRLQKRKLSAESSSGVSRSRIGDQFSDLKAGLAKISAAEWDALPEVGDHSLKLSQKARFSDAMTVVPDSLILAAAGSSGTSALHKEVGASSKATDALVTLAASRGGQLGSRLDRMADDVQGQTVVDPRGYMTGLGVLRVNSDAEIGDLKHARLLLSSVTATNPKHAPGWIAAALLEETAGKIVAARKLAAQGCKECPDSEDVWLLNARLHDTHNAKVILADAVCALPQRVNIWLAASALESEPSRKKIVLRRALELIPGSVALWKAAVELEDADNARILLGRAVECAPSSPDLWLALVRLETHENARKVLNRMRQVLPTEPITWITAARLEEANGAPLEALRKIVGKMTISLTQAQVALPRERWLQEAEACEANNSPLTCAALIEATIGFNVEDEDRLDTWSSDAEASLARATPKVQTARAILTHALGAFPAERGLWTARVALERTHGTSEQLQDALRGAVFACPHVEVFWLLAAKQAWMSSGVRGAAEARDILQRACEANPASEAIWLAGVKLEWENGEVARARALSRKACCAAPSARVWMKTVLLEGVEGQTHDALALARDAIAAYPTAPKLYMIAGQLAQNAQNMDLARSFYSSGREKCPLSSPLWLLSAALEEALGNSNKARSLLESALVHLPSEDSLWVAAIRLEKKTNNDQAAAALMARGLQTLPSSGALWSEDLLTCPKAAQKSKSVDALTRCENDALVVLAVARLFERHRKLDKAQKSYQRAIALQPRLGDAWVFWFASELRVQATLLDSGNADEIAKQKQQGILDDIESRCASAIPNRGEVWNRVHKRFENYRLSPAQVLRRCVEEITVLHV
jgi:pre-mRNA-processing factor 6